MKQIIEDQKQASQDERHGAHLGGHAGTQLLDGAHRQRQDAPPAFLREAVEEEQQQLQVLHVQVFRLSRHHPLQGTLLHGRQKPATGERRTGLGDKPERPQEVRCAVPEKADFLNPGMKRADYGRQEAICNEEININSWLQRS